MMLWSPDTCLCEILCDSPSTRGTFQKRCRIHPSPNTTIDVYAHNLANRITPAEFKTDGFPRDTAITRKRTLKESTR